MHPQSTPSPLCPVCGTSFVGYTTYCSRACFRAQGPRRPLAERFWEKVQRTEGCWLWTGAVNRGGYGIIGRGRRASAAHRVAYELTYGPIPAGLLCCHRCDNRLCVRPDHLFVADTAANNADCKAKGRTRNRHTGSLPRACAAVRRPVPRRSVEERFWEKVVKTESCWLWRGSRNPAGYGMLRVDGRCVKAHRLAYVLSVGPIPAGLDCCHSCDTPSCVRPAHLWLGTRAQNLADMARKKRGWGRPTGPVVGPERRARGERNGAHSHPESRPRGERNGGGGHKLTTADVQAIRRLYTGARGDYGRLGRQFGVSADMVRLIVLRHKWVHVP